MVEAIMAATSPCSWPVPHPAWGPFPLRLPPLQTPPSASTVPSQAPLPHVLSLPGSHPPLSPDMRANNTHSGSKAYLLHTIVSVWVKWVPTGVMQVWHQHTELPWKLMILVMVPPPPTHTHTHHFYIHHIGNYTTTLALFPSSPKKSFYFSLEQAESLVTRLLPPSPVCRMEPPEITCYRGRMLTSSTAEPTAQASGFPPYVLKWRDCPIHLAIS